MKAKAILTLSLLLAIGQEAWAEGEVVVTNTTTQLDGKTYVVENNVTISSRITVAENQSATLIISGCTLTCEAGINVGEGETLNIQGTGTLIAYGDTKGGAAIGGNQNYTSGTINIREATVKAHGGADGAGIGGGSGGKGGTINIYSGIVEAYGNISNTDYSTSNGAGIGGGSNHYGGTINIMGGTVTACGGEGAEGIGAGQGATGTDGTSRTLGPAMAVYTGDDFSNRANAADRVTKLGENKVMVKPCDHSGLSGAGKCTGCDVLLLMDRGDNATVLSTYNNQDMKAVLISGRTLYKDGSWNTLCLPFSLSSEKIATVFGTPTIKTLSSSSFADGTLTLNFTTANEIEAGKPYLIKWSTGSGNIENPVFENVTISNTPNDIQTDKADFKGNLSAFNLTADNTILYLASDNKLYTPRNNKTSLGAFRAYFKLNGLTAGSPQQSAGVRAFVLDFGVETAIKGVIRTPDSNKACYDLNGRKLAQPVKGINIINGRKVVVK